jgi:hypothetical protein
MAFCGKKLKPCVTGDDEEDEEVEDSNDSSFSYMGFKGGENGVSSGDTLEVVVFSSR